MKITNDTPSKCPNLGQHDDFFKQLTRENNCIVFDSVKDMERISQSLERWSKRSKMHGFKVRKTKHYEADGMPRCWLIFPEVEEGPKTTWRGNSPQPVMPKGKKAPAMGKAFGG